jgi:UDP-glucose 4-epimerase
VSDLTRPVEWRPLLKNVETVVHLAGIAHAGPGIAEAAYDRVNRLATAELADASRAIGIRHLVFVSSIRAQSAPVASHVLTEADEPQPTDAYGRSKLAAEEAVRTAGVPFTILRPVLIYGPGVRGNLARLMRLAQSPWPLPLRGWGAKRSLLARQNLIGGIHLALTRPETRNETYVVADPEPMTLAEIVAARPVDPGRERIVVSLDRLLAQEPRPHRRPEGIGRSRHGPDDDRGGEGVLGSTRGERSQRQGQQRPPRPVTPDP